MDRQRGSIGRRVVASRRTCVGCTPKETPPVLGGDALDEVPTRLTMSSRRRICIPRMRIVGMGILTIPV